MLLEYASTFCLSTFYFTHPRKKLPLNHLINLTLEIIVMRKHREFYTSVTYDVIYYQFSSFTRPCVFFRYLVEAFIAVKQMNLNSKGTVFSWDTVLLLNSTTRVLYANLVVCYR